jgi:cytochrome c553
MHRYIDDLREIERLLVAGNLSAARVRAHLLAMPATDPGLKPWAADFAQLAQAARDLAMSPDVDEGCHRVALVSLACAGCHARSGRLLSSGPMPPLPIDDGTTPTRMARHQWAVDRLWEGMVLGSLRSWRSGLDVLTGAPLISERPGATTLAQRLHDLARDSLVDLESGNTTLNGRAYAYGDVLATCAACHALPRAL